MNMERLSAVPFLLLLATRKLSNGQVLCHVAPAPEFLLQCGYSELVSPGGKCKQQLGLNLHNFMFKFNRIWYVCCKQELKKV